VSFSQISRVALLNFGGIGDEILFEPTIRAIRGIFPESTITLFLEDRSRVAVDLLPQVDQVQTIAVQSCHRVRVFQQLWQQLRSDRYDVVVSSGSSPFISLLLALSGIPYRFGFNSGKVSQWFLSRPTPLDLYTYAGAMYYTLAQTTGAFFQRPVPTSAEAYIPHIAVPEAVLQQWQFKIRCHPTLQHLVIHPGVSQVSQQKRLIKRWEARHWATVIHTLSSVTYCHLVGGPDDAETIDAIMQQLPPNLSNFCNHYGHTKGLLDLAAIIAHADVMLCLDSAPMHVAVGLGKPLVALFGPQMMPYRLLPNDHRFHYIQSPPLSPSATSIDIDPAQVIEQVKTVLFKP